MPTCGVSLQKRGTLGVHFTGPDRCLMPSVQEGWENTAIEYKICASRQLAMRLFTLNVKHADDEFSDGFCGVNVYQPLSGW